MSPDESLDLLASLRDAIDIACYAIRRLLEVEKDRDYWQKQHAKLLNESIHHTEAMTGNLLMLVLQGRIKSSAPDPPQTTTGN